MKYGYSILNASLSIPSIHMIIVSPQQSEKLRNVIQMPKLLTQFFPRHIQAPLCLLLKRLTPFPGCFRLTFAFQQNTCTQLSHTLVYSGHFLFEKPSLFCAHTLLGSFILIFIPSCALVCVHLYCRPVCVHYKHGQTVA